MILLALALTLSKPTMLPIINEYRIENHLSPVTVNEQACKFAKIRAKEASPDWSHNGFHKREKLLAKTGYIWYENLATDFATDKEVLEGWKASPSHNKTLLSNIKYACVSRYKNTWAFEGMEPNY